MSRSRAGRVIGGPTTQRRQDGRTTEEKLRATIEHQIAVIKYLEKRGDRKKRENTALRNQIQELGGKPE